MHAETVGYGNASVIVRLAAPLSSSHSPSNKGPIEHGCDGSGDQPSTFGFGFEPAADLADTPSRIEGDEHDTADQNLVVPDSVDSGSVRGVGVRVPAEGGAGAINGVRDERLPDPRSNVLPRPVKNTSHPHICTNSAIQSDSQSAS